MDYKSRKNQSNSFQTTRLAIKIQSKSAIVNAISLSKSVYQSNRQTDRKTQTDVKTNKERQSDKEKQAIRHIEGITENLYLDGIPFLCLVQTTIPLKTTVIANVLASHGNCPMYLVRYRPATVITYQEDGFVFGRVY